jgi:hypothetical protein
MPTLRIYSQTAARTSSLSVYVVVSLLLASSLVLTGCAYTDEEVDRVRQRLMKKELPDLRGQPVDLTFSAVDEIDGRTLPDFTIVGTPYVKLGRTPINWYRSQPYRGYAGIYLPIAATKAKLVSTGSVTKYRIEAPNSFALAAEGDKISKGIEWSGRVSTQDYCVLRYDDSTYVADIANAIAASHAGGITTKNDI